MNVFKCAESGDLEGVKRFIETEEVRIEEKGFQGGDSAASSLQ